MYRDIIRQATGASESEAAQVEDVMRNDIFHSTLDWQPRALFEKAARLALKIVRDEPVPIRVARAIERGTAVLLR